MRKVFIAVAALAACYCAMAELNYRAALQDARASEGTDQAITNVLHAHGFNKDWNDTITFTDKLKALIP